MHTADSWLPPPEEAAALRQLIMGFRTTQLVHVAAKFGLADQFRRPRSSDDVAAGVGAEPQALHRLLRALASLGLFHETAGRTFQTTAMGRLLESDISGSLRSLAVLYGTDWLWAVYGRLDYSVATGLPAFDEVHGQPYYDHLQAHPSVAATFNAAMSGFSNQESTAIAKAYDFSGGLRIVDVGGGQGTLLTALLQANPSATGIVLDLAPAVMVAQEVFRKANLEARARGEVGNFFIGVPKDADIYLLKSVLHNWSDSDARRILQTCRNAMSRQSRLIVVERIIPEGDTPSEAKLFDINMLVVVGGRERSTREYATLFEEAGLRLTRVIETATHLSLIEAVPT